MIADADDHSAAESVAPIAYRIDAGRRVVYVTLRGDVTSDGLRRSRDGWLADPGYQPGMALYVDCRVLTSIPTRDEIRRLAIDRLVRATRTTNGRVAIVVMTRLGMDYAAAWELFGQSAEGPLAVFTSHADAHRWLGVTVPKALD
jgi:hypothetical protein